MQKIGINQRLRRLITSDFVRDSHAYKRYVQRAEDHLRRGRDLTVLDVGAGRTWHFDPALRANVKKLIGQDIDEGEMALNPALDQRIVGDACSDLGVPEGSVDLITARSVVEHLPDNAGFVRACYRSLRSGGCLIAVFPGRYAPFAVLNRVLPHRVTVGLLHRFVPGSEGILGFKAYYDRTHASGFRRLLLETGFTVEEEYQSWFSSGYFGFFFPLYAASLGVDYLRRLSGRRDLASFNLFVARKP